MAMKPGRGLLPVVQLLGCARWRISASGVGQPFRARPDDGLPVSPLARSTIFSSSQPARCFLMSFPTLTFADAGGSPPARRHRPSARPSGRMRAWWHWGGRLFIKTEFASAPARSSSAAPTTLSQMSADERARASSAGRRGNHARGSRRSRRLMKTKATIVMPADAWRSKFITHAPPAPRSCSTTWVKDDSRGDPGADIALGPGATVVPPYDHPVDPGPAGHIWSSRSSGRPRQASPRRGGRAAFSGGRPVDPYRTLPSGTEPTTSVHAGEPAVSTIWRGRWPRREPNRPTTNSPARSAMRCWR